MSSGARTWVFAFGLIFIVCALGYGALGVQHAPLYGGTGTTMVCGPAFGEDPNAHVGDFWTDGFHPDDPYNAMKNAYQQEQCDNARHSAGESVRSMIAFGVFCMFFAFLHNPFGRRRSGTVSLTAAAQALENADAIEKSRKARKADRRRR